MKITYYGHSCFAVQVGDDHILFDPFISPNELARDVDIDRIDADYIFISHAHFDHIFDASRIAERTGATVIGNWEIREWAIKNGIKNTHPMNPGEQWAFPFGTVKCVNAVHSSSFSDGSYGGSACGFVFKTSCGNFYYSGDTALTLDMELIRRWTALDLLILPIGDALTMGPADAIEVSKMLDVTKVMGVHYDTFGFIRIDHEEVNQQFKDNDIYLLLPPVGGTLTL